MFEPNVKRKQKYCSQACSVRANNARSIQRYNRRKEMLSNPRRVCANAGCNTILRRDNEGTVCESCSAASKRDQEKSFRDMVLGN